MNIKVVTDNKQKFIDLGWSEFASVAESLKYFEGKPVIAYDSETSGLGFMFSKIWCIQLGDSETQFVVDIESIDIQQYKRLLESKTLLGHNMLFDVVFLYANDIWPYKVYDTFLAESCLTLGIKLWKRDLASCLKRYLDIDMSKDERSDIINKGLHSSDAIEYSGLDVAFLHDLMEAQKPLIDKRDAARVIEKENNATLAFAYMEICGFYQNEDALYKWIRRIEYEEYKAELELNQFVLDTYPSLEFNKDEFNWASPQQVIALFKRVGINTWDKKQEKDSVDKTFIKKQADKFQIIKEYLNYKDKEGNVSKYGRVWYKHRQQDGRIHTKFKLMVETGRTSCGNAQKGPFPNIQNITKDPEFRATFQAPKGRNLVICDYSGQESVILADFSQEPKLIEFYLSGEADLHAYVAKLIYAKELGHLSLKEIKAQYPKLRGNSKSVNFTIVYGGNEYTIAEDTGLTPDEALQIYNSFFKVFSKLKKYFEEKHKLALKQGYVLINEVTGRRRYIYGNKKYIQEGRRDKKHENLVYKMALNTPCQGTGADMSKEAMYRFFMWIKTNKLLGKVLIVNFIHDEIVAECSKSMTDKVCHALQSCMEESGNMFLQTLKIKAEPEVSTFWKKD